MKCVLYPQMRALIREAVGSLSDRAQQVRTWLREEPAAGGQLASLTLTLQVLLGETAALRNPAGCVGETLYGNEVTVLRDLGAVLAAVVAELGAASDRAYLAHPQWREVLHRATVATRVLHDNDGRVLRPHLAPSG